MMGSKAPTIDEQIAAIKRHLLQIENTNLRLVKDHQIIQECADKEIACFKSALDTLVRMRRLDTASLRTVTPSAPYDITPGPAAQQTPRNISQVVFPNPPTPGRRVWSQEQADQMLKEAIHNLNVRTSADPRAGKKPQP